MKRKGLILLTALAALLCAETSGARHAAERKAIARMAEEHVPLSLSVRPAVCASPCAIRARAIVEPHPDNRVLTLTVDSEVFRRSSTVYLEGKDAARAYSRVFTHLPAGVYVIEVRLRRSGGAEVVRDLPLEVIGDR